MIYTGKRVYDPLTDTYSTGYWIKDNQGYWYDYHDIAGRYDEQYDFDSWVYGTFSSAVCTGFKFLFIKPSKIF